MTPSIKTKSKLEKPKFIFNKSKLIERSFLQKAVEGYAEYKAHSEEEQAFRDLQMFLEDLGKILMEKGIKEIRGSTYELHLPGYPYDED